MKDDGNRLVTFSFLTWLCAVIWMWVFIDIGKGIRDELRQIRIALTKEKK